MIRISWYAYPNAFINMNITSKNSNKYLLPLFPAVRETGLMIFSHEWPSGAQGVLMMPTGVNEVTVTFPHTVQHVNVSIHLD